MAHSYPPTASSTRSLRLARITSWVGFVCVLLAGLVRPAWLPAQDVKIWEFSPYDVELWYAFDDQVVVSQAAKQKLIDDLQHGLDRTFQAAWNATASPMPDRLSGQLSRHFDDFTLDDLTYNEYILVVSAAHPDTKTLRTFEAAVSGLPTIHVTAQAHQAVVAAAEAIELPDDSPTSQMLGKLSVEAGGMSAIAEQLTAGSIAAALVPRSELAGLGSEIRALMTMLPWQTDVLFRQRDKLFFVLIGMSGDQFTLKVRELDCPMQFLGPVMQDATYHWSNAARLTTAAVVRAFAPVARVEDAETKTAELRHRAGGLIIDDQNPARIHVGDVLQPIVRRDDRNGIPTLLEPLSFTYAAVTASDGVKMNVNVYTYSGGPGLQGRQNRRTQRVLLRVRPIAEQSDLRIAIRGDTARSQAGCFVYQRDWLTEDFEFLGRTDWRGRLTIKAADDWGGILPESIRRARFEAKLAAARAAEERAAAEAAAAQPSESSDGEPAGDTAAPAPADAPAGDAAEIVEYPPGEDPDVIPLNFPLLQIYIKSGDTVLAKLPMVPGLQPVQTAELPDDSLRLQAEAFVRGFQGDILDLIGLRNLLAARVQLYIKEDKLEQADEVLNELRRLRNYNELADELSLIQRRMLEEAGDDVPRSAKIRIDRMFQTTRDMLQKYLQDNLVPETERALDAARSTSTTS